MWFIISCVVLFLSLVLGAFGFPQIVGTIKYFRNYRMGSAFFTIVLWSAILGFGAYAVINWLERYTAVMYIGYGVSFLLSLGTKPDTPIQPNNKSSVNNDFISKEDFDIDTSFMTEEDKKAVEDMNEIISTLTDTYNNAVRDLGDYTLEDAKSIYENGFINESKYDELKNAIESLIFVKEVYPERILKVKEKRKEIIAKYV